MIKLIRQFNAFRRIQNSKDNVINFQDLGILLNDNDLEQELVNTKKLLLKNEWVESKNYIGYINDNNGALCVKIKTIKIKRNEQ